MVRALGQHCGSTALALAMHTHQVAIATWRWRHEGGAMERLLRQVAAQETILVTSGGSDWLEIGAWGRDGRISHLRLDRVFVLGEDDIRREGAVLDADLFARVAARLMKLHGWSAG